MAVEMQKPRTRRTGLIAGILIAVAVAAVIIPVSIFSFQKSTAAKTENDYIRIGKSSQTVFGLTCKFSINYTIVSKNVIGVFCYLDKNPIQYNDRKSFLVGTNLPIDDEFNVTVNIGNVFVQSYYCYVTAKYKIPTSSPLVYQSNETGFLDPVNVTLHRADPSKVTIPPTTTKPVKPVIDFAVRVIFPIPVADTIFKPWIVFHSQYGRICPNIGYTIYESRDGGTVYAKIIHFDTDNEATLSTFSGSVAWEGEYASTWGGLGYLTSTAPTGTWVFTGGQYGAKSGDTIIYKIVTTLYGVESDPALISITVESSVRWAKFP